MNPPDQSPHKKEKPLSEKDFIQDGWSLSSFPFWLWIFLMAALIGIFLGTSNWYQSYIREEKSHEPFLEVTNRQFSVFLWDFPSFMRINLKKTGYLSGFSPSAQNFEPETAEEFVLAPPEVIFLYHTWHRLLSSDYISRPITLSEFAEFLDQMTEWQPKNWKNAPDGYAQLVEQKKYVSAGDLQTLPESELPLIVRQSFQGWRNYFKDGETINKIDPTIDEVLTFLIKHPTYARPFWRNIGEIDNVPVAGLNYLKDLLMPPIADAKLPNDQLSSFLKVAIYTQMYSKIGNLTKSSP